MNHSTQNIDTIIESVALLYRVKSNGSGIRGKVWRGLGFSSAFMVIAAGLGFGVAGVYTWLKLTFTVMQAQILMAALLMVSGTLMILLVLLATHFRRAAKRTEPADELRQALVAMAEMIPEEVKDSVEKQPLVMLAVAFGIGALIAKLRES